MSKDHKKKNDKHHHKRHGGFFRFISKEFNENRTAYQGHLHHMTHNLILLNIARMSQLLMKLIQKKTVKI